MSYHSCFAVHLLYSLAVPWSLEQDNTLLIDKLQFQKEKAPFSYQLVPG